MPEELNRIVTDQLSHLLFIHSPEARENLLREGCEHSRIHAVGNTMIDTLGGDARAHRAVRCARATRLGERRLPGGDPAPSCARRRSAAGRGRRGACARGPRAAGRLPRPSAHPRRIEGERLARRGGLRLLEPWATWSSSACSKAPPPADRFGRHPGGGDLSRCPLLHPAREHRAPDHMCGGHQHAARARAGANRGDPVAARVGLRSPNPCAPGWDGAAAGRIVDILEREPFTAAPAGHGRRAPALAAREPVALGAGGREPGAPRAALAATHTDV